MYWRVSRNAGEPAGRGPMLTIWRRCSQALALSNAAAPDDGEPDVVAVFEPWPSASLAAPPAVSVDSPSATAKDVPAATVTSHGRSAEPAEPVQPVKPVTPASPSTRSPGSTVRRTPDAAARSSGRGRAASRPIAQ